MTILLLLHGFGIARAVVFPRTMFYVWLTT